MPEPTPPIDHPPARNRLAIETQGEGRPLVVVPWGPGAFGSLYRWALQPLAEQHQLVHWHYRGCGKSSQAERYSMEDDLWDLTSLIEQLGLDRPILLGHSYGGMVALYLATEYPHLVGGLILVNCLPRGADLRLARQRRKEQWGTRRFVQWEHRGLRCIAGEANGEEKLKYLEDEARFMVRDERHVEPIMRRMRLNFHVLASVQESLQAFDVTKRLREIQVPCLVTAGSHDPIVGEGPKQLHLGLPGSNFRRFTESGHFPFLEQPAEFHRVVSEWVAALPPQEPR